MLDNDNNPLGKETEYKSNYDPWLLFSIERNLGRAKIGISSSEFTKSDHSPALPFFGFDVWNCYEISWLNESGKPQVSILKFFVPCESPSIVESKSVKLYFNSFNNTKFSSKSDLEQQAQKDLSKATGSEVIVEIRDLEDFYTQALAAPRGDNIDELDIEISDYDLSDEYLKVEDSILLSKLPSDEKKELISETLYSNLLRSNCLITNQPDWGSVEITYSGAKIDRESLLRYIISFRNHNEFHEQCVERIFCDIMKKCAPSSLTVEAKYTRRGGIDINPIRSTYAVLPQEIDTARLPRQ